MINHNYNLMNSIKRIHWAIVITILLISTLGFMMLYSAAGGNINPWAKSQFIKFIPAFILMFVIALTPIKIIMRAAYPFYILCVGLLLFVEIAGHIGMGAQRWIAVGGVNIQPSELTKIAVIMVLARYFHFAHHSSLSSPRFLIPPLLLMLLPAMLILKQPNLGTATVLTTIGIIIFFAAGVQWRYFIALGITVTAAIPIGWQFLHDYQKQRVLTFLDPQQDPLGAGYNIIQSVIAIGSGGLTGKGYLKGSQGQLDFLPEKQTDFIFTMLAEEFGFIGCAGLILCYIILMTLGYRIALRSRNRFGAFLAIGVSSMLFLHLFINVGMSMGILPVVGVPLPLFSYGGSMMIAILLGYGLVLNAWANRDLSLEKHRINVR